MKLIDQVPGSGFITDVSAEFLVVNEEEPGNFTNEGLVVLERALTGLVPFVIRGEYAAPVTAENCLETNKLIERQQRLRTSAIAKMATELYEGDWADYVEDPSARYPQSTPPHFDGLIQQYWQARIATYYGPDAAPSSVVIDRYEVGNDSFEALIELYAHYKLHGEKGAGYRTIMPYRFGSNLLTDRLVELLGQPRATYNLKTDHGIHPVFFPNGYSMHPDYRSPEKPSDFFVHTFSGVDPNLRRVGVSSVIHRLGWFL